MQCNRCGMLLFDNVNTCPCCGNTVSTVSDRSADGTREFDELQNPNVYGAQGPSAYGVQTSNWNEMQNRFDSGTVNQSADRIPERKQTPTEDPIGPDGKILDPVIDSNGREYGMKWFKFTIYVQLFLSMILKVLSGVFTVTGLQFGREKELIYLFFPGLRVLGIICGSITICIALYGFHVRKRLANFRFDGPSLYYRFYWLSAINLAVYLIVGNIIAKGSLSIGSGALIQIIETVLMLIINSVYFSNRRFLFCKLNA